MKSVLLGSGIIMTILDPSTFHGYTDSLQRHLDGVARHGTEAVADELCDVLDLSYMDGQRAWRLWISQRDRLPRKLEEWVHVAMELHAQETWTDLALNGEIDDQQFAWTPPDDWQSWQLPEFEQALLKEGTAAPEIELKLADGKPAKLSDYRGENGLARVLAGRLTAVPHGGGLPPEAAREARGQGSRGPRHRSGGQAPDRV